MYQAAALLLLGSLALTLGCADDATAPQPVNVGGSGEGPSGGGVGPSAAGAADDDGALDAPDEEEALVSFLTDERYADWAKEQESHPSSGPHGESVRVYYSPKATAALRAGDAVFPKGAATVKELFSEGALYGWAVWVKVQDETDAGKGFYWYERVDRGGKVSVYGNARGSTDCVGCHMTGHDYDLSFLPFE